MKKKIKRYGANKAKSFSFKKKAEKEYNRRKVVLNEEFTSEMHKACQVNDLEYFEQLKIDYRKYFGEESELTIISIEIMYGI